jgi:hypothetical protein
MSVMVDDQPLAVEKMGLQTIGQVLSHVQQSNRLVVNLLIDGKAPDMSGLSSLRRSPLFGHTVYIETAEPREIALNVLAEVEEQLDQNERRRTEAVDLLQQNKPEKSLEKLGGWFHTWHAAQESVSKVSQLLRIDLNTLRANGQPVAAVLEQFAAKLREIKSALENRDFVALNDVLSYEMTGTENNWRELLAAIRGVIDCH